MWPLPLPSTTSTHSAAARTNVWTDGLYVWTFPLALPISAENIVVLGTLSTIYDCCGSGNILVVIPEVIVIVMLVALVVVWVVIE